MQTEPSFHELYANFLRDRDNLPEAGWGWGGGDSAGYRVITQTVIRTTRAYGLRARTAILVCRHIFLLTDHRERSKNASWRKHPSLKLCRVST